MRLLGKSEHTIKGYSSDVGVFFNFHPLSVLLPDEYETKVRSFMEVQIKSHPASTSKRRLASLRMLAQAIEFPVPMVGYKMPSPAVTPAHPLPNGIDDAKRMLDVADTPEKRALVALTAFAGLRISEARWLRPSHVNRLIMSMRVFGKGGKERWVPVTDELLAILDACPRSDQPTDDPYLPWSDRGARWLFTELGRKAGLDRPVASHDGRMTFGSTVYDLTKDLRVVQELLGHASPDTTVRYTLVADKRKRDAVGGLW